MTNDLPFKIQARDNDGHGMATFDAMMDGKVIASERFQTREGRYKNQAALEPPLMELFLTRTTAEWLDFLTGIGIPCAPVHTIDQVVSDPQVRHREMIVELPQEGIGPHPFVNSPIRLDRTPAQVERGAPALGEHTGAVLRDLLGMKEEDVRGLRERGVV